VVHPPLISIEYQWILIKKISRPHATLDRCRPFIPLGVVPVFRAEAEEGDVVHITGDSGSGKLVLLRALKEDLGDQVVMGELNRDWCRSTGSSCTQSTGG